MKRTSALPDSPDVSIVIPCYNVAHCVARALDDALAVTGIATEVIAIDDGSTDATPDILSRYADRIRIERISNSGVSAARNCGTRMSRGEYIFFLDADDGIEPSMLREAVTTIKESNAQIAYGPAIIVFPSYTVEYPSPPVASLGALVRHILEVGFIGCAALWRTDFVKEFGGWKEGLRKNEDLEFHLRALSHHPNITSWCGREYRLIYNQTERSDRITSTVSDETFRSQIEIISFCIEHLIKMGYATKEARNLMLTYAYNLWLEAARSSSIFWEQRMRTIYFELGGSGHLGRPAHRVVASVIGLRNKERLSRLARRLKRR